jgi:hypothetical protein
MKQLIGIACLCWAVAAGAAEPAAPAQSKPEASQEDLSTTAGPRVNTSSPNVSPVGGTQPAAKDKPAGPDRLNLDTTIITGNRELPKVLYIVPWKKADIGELPSQPFNSLLDEALTPVDRDVFRREVNYYGVITGKTDATGAAVPTAQQQTATDDKPRQ